MLGQVLEEQLSICVLLCKTPVLEMSGTSGVDFLVFFNIFFLFLCEIASLNKLNRP